MKISISSLHPRQTPSIQMQPCRVYKMTRMQTGLQTGGKKEETEKKESSPKKVIAQKGIQSTDASKHMITQPARPSPSYYPARSPADCAHDLDPDQNWTPVGHYPQAVATKSQLDCSHPAHRMQSA